MLPWARGQCSLVLWLVRWLDSSANLLLAAFILAEVTSSGAPGPWTEWLSREKLGREVHPLRMFNVWFGTTQAMTHSRIVMCSIQGSLI